MGIKEKILGLFRSKKEGRSDSSPRDDIRKRYLLELENLDNAVKYDSEDVLMARLSGIVRDYFCEIFYYTKPMTLEEISDRMKNAHIDPKVKESMNKLLEALSVMEYSGYKTFKRDIKKFIKSFRELVKQV